MKRSATIASVVLLVLGAALSSALFGQTIGKGQTVRRHRVEDPSAAMLTQAEAAIDKRDYAAAEATLKDLVSKDPGNYRAWFDLAFVYNVTGQATQSIEAYRKSVAAKPDLFESNLNLGLMLARAGDPEAERYLRAATKLKPSAKPQEGWSRAWLSLGHVLEKKDPQQAVSAFRQAATLQPKDAEPHLSAGLLLEQQNDLAAAEKEYREAAALEPNSAEALAGLVNVYMKSKRLPEAETALRKYLEVSPTNATAHIQLGRVLAAEGKNDEALKELEAGVQASPDDPGALRELASLYDANKKYELAAAQYRRLLEKSPTDAELHRLLGLALLHQAKPAEAQDELLKAIKLKPDAGELYGDLALAASDNKNYGLTLQALEARAKLLPETPGTYFLRATAYDHLRYYKEAAENYHKFLEVAAGKFPDQEWQARHRLIAIDPKKK